MSDTETYMQWLNDAGFTFYSSCYCGGYTQKYKTSDNKYEVHIKKKNMRFSMKENGKVIAANGIYLLKDKLQQYGLLA